jgi:opacity protein-like surface antigen
MLRRVLGLAMGLMLAPPSLAASDAADAADNGRPLARPGNAPPPRTGPRGQPVRPAPVTVAPTRVVTRPVVQPVVVRPYHGVFVYGPRPTYHRVYRSTPQRVVQDSHLPTRRVDRRQTFGIGVRGGSVVSGYRGGSVFGDFGLGVLGRYRPMEVFGVEVLVSHHNESWDRATERAQTMGQLSGQLFITPWARVSPYVTAGLTGTFRHADRMVDFDEYGKRFLFGPHGGVGLEVNVGRHLAIDFEGRMTGYVNVGDDPITPRGAFQGNAAIVAYF